MSEPSWRPLFRSPASTLTRILRSPTFTHARERAGSIIESPAELRALADRVETLDHSNAPLSAISDRVCGAVRFLRATADQLDSSRAARSSEDAGSASESRAATTASGAARERLVVASLHYLITPDDLVPDFKAGGYVDDVLLLTWVFGAASNELAAHLPGDGDTGAT